MREILASLEHILTQLSTPELLDADEIARLSEEWDVAMLLLEQFPDSADAQALSLSDRIYLRVRLERVIQRLPEVQALLVANKSSVAQQIFTENRRFKSLRSHYAAYSGDPQLHGKA